MRQIVQSSPKIRYKEFTLVEIQQEFAPRQVYDNGDSYIIRPLPQESPIPFGIPKVLPVYQTAINVPTLFLFNPTVAFPLAPDIAKSFSNRYAQPTDYNAFFRVGHLVDLSEHGPQHDNSPKYRLDLRDFATADTVQVIMHYRATKATETTFPAIQSNLPTNDYHIYGKVDFHRQIISECEYIDHWLVRNKDDWYGALNTIYAQQYNAYLRRLSAPFI